MLFTGEPVTAQEAYQHGIVSEIVECSDAASDKELNNRVIQISKLIEANPKSVVALGKKSFYEQIKFGDLSEAYRVAGNAMVDNLKYEDTQSGLKAFASKSKPKWSHSSKKLID